MIIFFLWNILDEGKIKAIDPVSTFLTFLGNLVGEIYRMAVLVPSAPFSALVLLTNLSREPFGKGIFLSIFCGDEWIRLALASTLVFWIPYKLEFNLLFSLMSPLIMFALVSEDMVSYKYLNVIMFF